MSASGLGISRLTSARSAAFCRPHVRGRLALNQQTSARVTRRFLRAEPGETTDKVVEVSSPVVEEGESVERKMDTVTADGSKSGTAADAIESAPASASETTYKYEGPKQNKFGIAEGQTVTIAGASLPIFLRLGSGAFVKGYKTSVEQENKGVYSFVRAQGRQVSEYSDVIKASKRPAEPVIIYEFEGCPFCKKVREIVSILDLDVLFYPCPAGGPNFRPEAVKLGGKSRFPYMVDNNTGTSMYESDDIIAYLCKEYGDDQVPLALRLGIFTAVSCGLSLIGRIAKGRSYRASKLPEKPLILWGYEASPFCKIVKETLCELEIPHLYKSCARGSTKRQEMYEIAGDFQAPYLQDPNTGIAMFESKAMNEYLEKTYAV